MSRYHYCWSHSCDGGASSMRHLLCQEFFHSQLYPKGLASHKLVPLCLQTQHYCLCDGDTSLMRHSPCQEFSHSQSYGKGLVFQELMIWPRTQHYRSGDGGGNCLAKRFFIPNPTENDSRIVCVMGVCH